VQAPRPPASESAPRRGAAALAAVLAAALAAAAVLAAAPAAAAVRCSDAAGRSYTLPAAPGAGYRFFVHCEPGAPVAERGPEIERYRQQQGALVIWPGLRPPGLRVAGEKSRRAAPVPPLAPTTVARMREVLPLIHKAAARYDLDPYYLKALIHTESAFRADAVSPKGAQGLMQLMPATAQRFGVADPSRLTTDPEANVLAGARYLAHLRELFDDDWVLVTAAYNAGEGAVRRHGNRVPPFAETQHFVRAVDARIDKYRALGAATPAAAAEQ
jgi:hypothetical protein